MKWLIQITVVLAVILILCDQHTVEAKKQKQGRNSEKAAAKNENYKKDFGNSRKTRDVSGGEQGNKQEKYNKGQQQESKYQKEGKQYTKNNKKNQKYEKNSKQQTEYVDKKYAKQQKKEGTMVKDNNEYVAKKSEKYSNNAKKEKVFKSKNEDEKVTEEDPINGEEIVEEAPAKQVIEESEKVIDTETEINVEEKVQEDNKEESVICECQNKQKKDAEKKPGSGETLVSCNKKLDKRNSTETCEKYKLEKNSEVIQETVIAAEKQDQSVLTGTVGDSCKT